MHQDQDDTATFTMGDIIFDAVTMNEAAVRGDLDESRLRARRIAFLAAPEGLTGIAQAANELLCLLGPSGTEPQPGFGAAMVAISTEIDRAFGEG
jgi:4-phytase/acid phosphatase